MRVLTRVRSAEDYYATLVHELTHSTAYPSRPNSASISPQPAPFGSPDYSKEEFGAAFLCGHTGIFPRTAENQAAYISGWLSALKGDKRLLHIAAAQAQKAADFTLGTVAHAEQPEQPEE